MTSEELQKLLDEADEGPWVVNCDEGVKIRGKGGSLARIMQVNLNGRKSSHEVAANARLIAAAPEAIAELLRVRQERDELRDELARVKHALDLLMQSVCAVLAKWGAR